MVDWGERVGESGGEGGLRRNGWGKWCWGWVEEKGLGEVVLMADLGDMVGGSGGEGGLRRKGWGKCTKKS